MGNQAYLIRTKFEADHGDTRWGWRIGDDYVQSYTDYYTEEEVPTDPLELLANAACESTEEERDLLENLLEFERGIVINGSWHEFEAIGAVLRKALYGRKENNFLPAPQPSDTRTSAAETDPCSACTGRGWLLTLNTDTAALEIQRCDCCGHYATDQDARKSVASDETARATVLLELCNALLAEAKRGAENPEEPGTAFNAHLRTIRDSLQNAVDLLVTGPAVRHDAQTTTTKESVHE